MKAFIKAASLFLSVAILLSCLFSCSGGDVDTLDTVTEFERDFMTGGRIYSSAAAEGEDGYISREMVDAFFGRDLPSEEYSLLVYSSLTEAQELGVFLLSDTADRPELISVIEERIKLFSSFFPGDSFILEKGRVISYGFFDNAEEAKKLLKSLL